ncbi:histone [Candidatus Woesearchaeota archaeon]|nr:histone [Candidatus Woesearchaeota archaeon]
MGRNKEPITPAVMARILTKAGAPRVSKEAAVKLAEIVQDKAEEISKKAVEIAEHAKRNTVMEGDIRLASK